MRLLSFATAAALGVGIALTGCSGPAVEQRTWVLESFGDESAPVEPVHSVVSQFSLADGMISGNGGVNNFNGTYELSGDDISFGPFASTKMAGPTEAMEQETRFFEALESAAHVDVRDERMTLSDDDDAVLILLVSNDE